MALSKLYAYNKTSAQKFSFSGIFASCGSSLAKWMYSIPGASSTVCDIRLPYHKHGILRLLGKDQKKDYTFVSRDIAFSYALKARETGLESVLSDTGDYELKSTNVIGIGMTASLATDRQLKSPYRCYVCVLDSNGRKIEYNMRMENHDRVQQEEICSYLALDAFFQMFNATSNEVIPFTPISEWKSGVNPTRMSSPSVNPKQEIVNEIVSGKRTHALFIPHASLGQVPLCNFPFALDQSHSNITFSTVVLGGSFNPLHFGHEALVNFAADYVAKRKADEGLTNHKVLKMFEMSVRNPDKGVVSYEALNLRLHQFTNKVTSTSLEAFHDFNNRNGPYTVVLTNDNYARFVEKSYILRNSFMILGYDTATRLIDKKYYDNSDEAMEKKMLEIKDNGVEFLVFGRLNKNTQIFEDFECTRLTLPKSFRDMFIVISEAEFRMDLSSSEIRARN